MQNQNTTSSADITLHAMQSSDMDFLYQLYADSRATDITQLSALSEQDKTAFIHMQFNAQHQYYQQHYPVADYQIICKHDICIGRLYVNRVAKEMRIIDITLLQPYRSNGLGTALIKQLISEAQQHNKLLSLNVETNNRAKYLYQRLGFVSIKTDPLYTLMHWSA